LTDIKNNLNLGMVGNCAYSALIDAQARMVWCCLPRFDGDPVFNALLDDGPTGSVWAFEIENFARSEQRYEPNTAILKTRLYDTDGHGVEVTDFAPRFMSHARMFRPLTLVRRVKVLSGTPRLRVKLRPRFDWGRQIPTVTQGGHHVRFVGAGMTLRLTTDAPLNYVLDGTWFVADRRMDFILGPDETLMGGIEDTAHLFEKETASYWHTWTRRLAMPLEWQDAVIRAAITLKLCLFEDTGAIVAAMTTSIPEAPGSGRNWDYRYCWLRDAFFVVRALNSLSEVGTMEDYLRWLYNVVRAPRGGHIQPLYGIGLEEHLPEAILATCRATAAWARCAWATRRRSISSTTCTATSCWAQRRPFMTSGCSAARARPSLPPEAVGEQAWRVYDQPDAGMWELRTRARVHTSSALMSWAACDRLSKVAVALHLPVRASATGANAPT
jgi:GH15 family glucan-1,4-alpha-glucosidase